MKIVNVIHNTCNVKDKIIHIPCRMSNGICFELSVNHIDGNVIKLKFSSLGIKIKGLTTLINAGDILFLPKIRNMNNTALGDFAYKFDGTNMERIEVI